MERQPEADLGEVAVDIVMSSLVAAVVVAEAGRSFVVVARRKSVEGSCCSPAADRHCTRCSSAERQGHDACSSLAGPAQRRCSDRGRRTLRTRRCWLHSYGRRSGDRSWLSADSGAPTSRRPIRPRRSVSAPRLAPTDGLTKVARQRAHRET